jgi:hypothetical protein
MLSEKILLDRTGNFTASENHRLMAGWDKPAPSSDFYDFRELHDCIKHFNKKPLARDIKEAVDCTVTGDLINRTWAVIQHEKPPTGLITYAEEKAIEEFFNPDPSLNFSTVHTLNGEEREIECMERLSKRTGIEFINTGENQIHVHADGVGVTPDGIAIDDIDLIRCGAEAKCKSPRVHAQNMLIKTNSDMVEHAFEAFVQVHTGMLVTSLDHWYFSNFNPYSKYKALEFGYIIVERDDDFIKILSERIETAKKIKASFYSKLSEITN